MTIRMGPTLCTRKPEKGPRLPAHRQPKVEERCRAILVREKPKVTFQWPSECQWPFPESKPNLPNDTGLSS